MKYLALILVLSGCASDKVMHFGAGAGISTIVTEATDNPVNGVIAAAGAGVLKETVDAANGGKFDLNDVAATILGGLVSLIKWEVNF